MLIADERLQSEVHGGSHIKTLGLTDAQNQLPLRQIKAPVGGMTAAP